nr:cupin domain-containing protein [uncultured Desulfobacter sp.]
MNHPIEKMTPIDLIDHPEGGRYREVFRSDRIVSKNDGSAKPALTHIYFSLNPEEISRFHKVTSDEIWNLYQGEGIHLFLWNETDSAPQCVTLSAQENCFCHVVPAGVWQAAAPISETVLVGCSVAPGFEFSDFTLMVHESQEAQKLVSLAPELAGYISDSSSR